MTRESPAEKPAYAQRLKPDRPTSAFIAALLVGLALTCIAVWTVRELERQRTESAFREFAIGHAAQLRQTIGHYLNDLAAVDALFHASEKVTATEFTEFVRTLRLQHSGLRAIEWIPGVPAHQRRAYEMMARERWPNFSFTELTADGRVQIAGQRPVYFPVYYIEPLASNERALGLDVASNPERREALFAARDSGAPATTPPIELVQARTGQRRALLVFFPHYRIGPHNLKLDERKKNLEGFIVGVFEIEEIVRDAARAGWANIEVEVLAEETALASHPPKPAARQNHVRAWDRQLVYEQSVPFGNRDLIVRFRPSPHFLSEAATLLPATVFVAGTLLTLLVAAYVAALRNEIARRHVTEMALRESEERYRVLIEQAPEAVLVLDADTNRFIEANEKALLLTKTNRQELLAMSPLDLSARIQPNGQPSAEAVPTLIRESFSGKIVMVEWLVRDLAGREIPCEMRPVPLPAAGRRILRVSLIDISDRKREEQRQLLMIRELDHRVKNNLATMLALAEQSGDQASTVAEFRASFVGRVRAMAGAHEALARRKWCAVPSEELARVTLAAFADRVARARIRISGASIPMTPLAGTSISMVLHELATNALKYGSLSSSGGFVKIHWHRAESGGVSVLWSESAGPQVQPPSKLGLGTRLIRGIVEHELFGHVTFAYRAKGFSCHIELPESCCAEASLLEEDRDGALPETQESRSSGGQPPRRAT